MSQLAKFTEDRRGYKLSVKGRWKVEQGQLVSVRESFSGQTEHSVDEIVAVTAKNLLLRAANGRLIHFIRKEDAKVETKGPEGYLPQRHREHGD